MKNDNALISRYILDNLYDGVYVVAPDRKIIYWNNGAEHITGYDSPEVIGKPCWDNLLIHVDGSGQNLCHTQCPLLDTINDGKLREEEVYLHHKDGHRVPVLVRVLPVRGLDNQIIGGVEIFSDNTSRVMLQEKIDELQRMNTLDKLTKIFNRGYIEIQMTSELSKMQRYGWPLGVLFIDIDHFKEVNDTYGHEVGDKVLKMVASTMSSNSRPFDIIGRWGGEEFVAVLVNVTTKQINDIANRYRILVEQSKLFIESSVIQVTISIGATLAQPTDKIEGLIDRADRLMYKSKLAGRNRITMDQ